MAMDIPRSPEVAKKRKVKRVIFSVVALLVVAFVTVVLAKLRPAAPTVERGTVWKDTVKRGEMLRQVRGPGTLVPEDIRWITSTTDATVDRIVTLPSAQVLKPDTVILELRDPKAQQSQLDAELDLKAAQADLSSLKVRLNNVLLQQEADDANIQALYHKAKIQAEANEQLS
jgi:HlyD family secretion protein